MEYDINWKEICLMVCRLIFVEVFFFLGNGYVFYKCDLNIYMFIEMIGFCKEILVSDEFYNMLCYLNLVGEY